MLAVLTNSGDATADYLLSHLSDASVEFVRFDTDTLLQDISFSYRRGKPYLQFHGRSYSPSDFSTVWYRRPEQLHSDEIPNSPEGKCVLDEWSEALESFFAHIPRSRWINHPAANVLASRKLQQLTTAESLGFLVPDTLVTQDEQSLCAFFRQLQGEVIVKPLGRAYIERPNDHDSLIFTNPVSECDLQHLTDLARCPTLFQQRVRKRADIRITAVDGMLHAVSLVATDDGGRQRCDIRRNNMADVAYAPIMLPADIAEKVHALISSYGLRFGAIDMAIAEDGHWYFFEINPNGQWAWLDIAGASTIYSSFISSFKLDAERAASGG